MVTRLLTACVAFSVRWAVLIAVAAGLLTAWTGYYTATHMAINTDTSEMIDPDLPFRQAYEDFNESFPQLGETFLIVINAAAPEQADQAASALAAELRAQPALFKDVFAPDTGPFFQKSALLYLDVDELSEVSDQLAQAQPVLSSLNEDPSIRGLFDILGEGVDDAIADGEASEGLGRFLAALIPVVEAAARDDPTRLSWQQFFAGEASDFADTRRFVMVQPAQDFSRLQPAKEALTLARDIAAKIEESYGPDLTLRFTGKIALNAEELQSVMSGAELAGVLSLILVAVVLGLGVRSARLVFAALATLVMGLVWTTAFALASVGSFNLVSVAFAVLFIGLGIDFGIHFCLRYQEEIVNGAGHGRALANTAAGVGPALSIAAPTTVLAFYAFVPTAYQGLSQLGLIAGTGIIISYISALTLLPALITLLPLKSRTAGAPRLRLHHANFVERHYRPILGVAALAGIIALAFAPQVRFDFDPTRLKDPTMPSVQVLNDLLADPEISPYSLQIVAGDATAADGLAQRLKALEATSRVVRLASFIPEDQGEKLDIISTTALFMMPVTMATDTVPPPDRAEQHEATAVFRDRLGDLAAMPGFGAAAALARDLEAALGRYVTAHRDDDDPYSDLEAALFAYFPYTIARLKTALEAEPVGIEDLPEDIRARYQTADGRRRIEVFPAEDVGDQQALRRFVAAVQSVVPEATGSPVQMVKAGDIVINSMLQATITAGVVITLFLLALLRSIRRALLVLIPVFLAGLLTAAATVWFSLPFNFANVIVLPLLIGLGVDSGIHLVMRDHESVTNTLLLHSSTPKAILLSALTTVGSFGSLAVSSHRGTASMGELLTISITLTVVCTLVILPGLLQIFRGRKRS